jgi:hypothetical protein
MAEIQLQAIIGEGEFGTVYKGTYNGVSKINVYRVFWIFEKYLRKKTYHNPHFTVL